MWDRSKKHRPHGITLLCSLLNKLDEALAMHLRLKLSVFERELAFFVIQHRDLKPGLNPLVPYQQLVIRTKFKASDVKKWTEEVLKYNDSPHLEEFQNWSIPKFPVSGAMLKEAGVNSGRFMGVVISELKNDWAESNFLLNAEELLKLLPSVISKLEERRKK